MKRVSLGKWVGTLLAAAGLVGCSTITPYTADFARKSPQFGAITKADAVQIIKSQAGRANSFIHALTENTAMLKIARNAGATVKHEGSESEAYLQLPPGGLDTRVSELVGEQFAEMDYQLKKQARQFWSLLADMQEIRQGVRDGRHQAAE